jgi:hypothetical protein
MRWMTYAVLLMSLTNTSDVSAVPGSIIKYWDPDTDQYIGSTGIEILPNGDYIASHAGFGPGHSALITYIYRSTDKGDTWEPYGSDPINENRLMGQTESSLFTLSGNLYSFGISSNVAGNPAGDWLSIRKSTDGGLSWTEPNSPTNGRLSTLSSGVGYSGGAAPVTVHNGRVWRSFEEMVVPGGPGSELFTSFVMSAPVNSDLLNAASWTRSTGVAINQAINPGWGLTEGNIVAKPNGDLVNITRVIGANEKASMINVAANGTTTSFNQVTGIVPFQGGGSMFEIRFDSKTNKYWTLANDQSPASNNRSILNLNSSTDLVNWTTEGTILQDSNTARVGFQYVDWEFDGNDIVAAIRTAYSGADNFHDSNYLTFRRIRNYAATSSVQSVTLDVAEDTELTNWVNWSNAPRGLLTPSDPPSYFGGALRVADDNFPTGAYAGTGNDGWVMMRWDLSSLATGDNSKLINNVDLKMIQLDGSVGEVEVYRINSGAWTESTVSWDSWVGGTVGDEDITLLGTMTNTVRNGVKDGITHFSDSDLRTLVQEWLDGTRENLGILLKWPESDATNGDTYASRESTTDDPPQLIIDFIDVQSADFDRDLDVDGRDFLAWQRGFNQFPSGNATKSNGDANGDGFVNNTDLILWQAQYGNPLPLQALGAMSSVPEPSTIALVLVTGILINCRRRHCV